MLDPDFLPIADPGSGGQTGTGSRIRNTACVYREKKQKAVMREKEILCRILTFTHSGSRIQGSKRHRIPDPGSATLFVCREKKQEAVMRENEILCRILTFYP